MSGISSISRISLFILLLHALNVLAAHDAGVDFGAIISSGVAYLEQGDIKRSIVVLSEAQQRAANDADRARDALQLGNLALGRKQFTEARRYYEEAQRLSGDDSLLRASAALNLARLQNGRDRLEILRRLSDTLPGIAAPATRARLQINLADQAQRAGDVRLAFQNLEAARTVLLPAGSSALLVEAFDALAQLYEDQGRYADSELLNAEGLAHLAKLDAHTAAELGVSLEWRQGRLSLQAGPPAAALAAYQRAADLLEMIRQALPIEYEDGRSTYSAMIEPLHLGLVELLLGLADAQTPALRTAYLRKARDVIELTRQAEMQDFLGDRCIVESVQGSNTALPAGTAVLYIALLQDHSELLLETPQGFERRRLDVDGKVVRTTAQDFAEQLRNGDGEYQGNSRQLYDWLIRPLEDVLSASQIQTLVIVSHDTLRLVAMAALHDGKQFLIEKYAVASATGMSMIQTGIPQRRNMQSLIAGLSEPGPVVDKLGAQLINQGLKAETQRKPSVRGMTNTVTSMRSIRASETLRESLSLPGVTEEVMAVGNTLNAKRLLNEGFTVDNFYREADGGEYRILHIASHGMFGGSAESSYILAYDDLLTLDGLQDLLKSDSFRKNPIEIISLSACQTAEGNERAPLGISGAAIKARARSVLGTLWPVEDISARTLMDRFYVGISKQGLSKGEALRRAQISLMQMPQYSHPLFWAPFTLIGNWQ